MTDQITYAPTVHSLPYFTMVYLADERVGMILESSDGFRYFPEGQREGRDLFQTLTECKRDLEGTDND